MPTTSRGTYTIQTTGSGRDSFVGGVSGSFQYVPFNLFALPVYALFIIGAVGIWSRVDRMYSGARYLVLAPAIAATFWGLLSEPTWGIVVGAPLQMVTATFLVWRVSRVGSSGPATALVLLGGVVGVIFGMGVEIPVLGPIVAIGLAIPMVFLGLVVSIPLALVRAALREGADARLWAAALVGLAMAFLTFIGVFLTAKSPVPALAASLAIFVLPVVVLIFLIRSTAWGHDVATGAMFPRRRKPSPTTHPGPSPVDGSPELPV